MPTASCRRSHVGDATKEPSPPSTPQSMTVSISLGANRQRSELQKASSTGQNHSPKQPPPGRALLSSVDTSKTPHRDIKKPPRKPPLTVGAKNNTDNISQIKTITQAQATAPAAAAATMKAAAPKRTKKVAKPEGKAKKAKVVSQAKIFPKKIKELKGKSAKNKSISLLKSPPVTKKKGGKSNSVSYGKQISSESPPATKKKGGKPNSMSSHGEKVSPKSPPVTKKKGGKSNSTSSHGGEMSSESPPATKKKGGKSNFMISHGEKAFPGEGYGSGSAKKTKSKRPRKSSDKATLKRAKKRSKKLKTSDSGIESKSKPDKSPPPVSIGKKPEPKDLIQYSQIKNLVSPVMDAVAIGINYCAYMFCDERPKVVISTKEAGQDNTATDQLELKSQNRSVRQTSSGRVGADQAAKAESAAPSAQMCKGQPLPQASSSGPEIHDVHSLTLAVNRFVLEVYCPFLVSAMKSTRTISPNPDRVRLSTMLAIREMLIMNSDKLFSFSALREPSAAATLREKVYLSHVFANSIVQVAAKKLHSQHPEGTFLASFKQATQDYDTKSDHFQFSLVEADARSLYVNANGKVVGEQESLVAKVGYNFARAKHPLFHGKSSSLTCDGNAQAGAAGGGKSLSRPIPTACAVFHIEQAPAYDSDEAKETAQAIESLKFVLRKTKKKQRDQG